MIQSEVHRIQSHCLVAMSNSSGDDQKLKEELKVSAFGVFNSLQIAQSNYISENYDKVMQSRQRSVSSNGTCCASCEYWQAWAIKSQEKLLLIEKKLIERQKVLQQKMKILHDELRNQNELWKIKQKQFLQEKNQDKQTITKLQKRTYELELLLRNGDSIQKYRKLSRNQNNLQTQWKQNQCQKIRVYKDENINSLVSQTSQFIESSDNGTNRKLGSQDKYRAFKKQVALKQLDASENENKNYQNYGEQNQRLNANLRRGFLRKNYHTFNDQQYMEDQKNKEKKEKVKEYGNQPSKTSLADPIGSRNTIKTLKLHNHKVSVEKSIFNKATTECSFVNISQQENENDKNWYSRGNPEINYNQYFDEGKKRENSQESQEIRKLKFENQNLKSYNRVLLQKLSNSRPKKY